MAISSTSAPCARAIAAVSARPAALMSAMPRRQPRAASCSAISRPRPPAAPVTSTRGACAGAAGLDKSASRTRFSFLIFVTGTIGWLSTGRRAVPDRGGRMKIGDRGLMARSIANLPDRETLIGLYEGLVLLRRFESVARVACRAGETPGFLHLYIGEEATGVGVCAHLRRTRLGDVDPPRARACARQGRRPAAGDGGALRQGGRDLRRARRDDASLRPLGRALRDERHRRRRHRARGRHRAWRRGRRGADDIGVAFFGDGASNHGAFHEGLNFAAVQQAPAVFVCENNLYATATPLRSDHAQPGDRDPGRVLRDAGGGGRRQRRARGLDRDARGGRAGAPRRRADADRGQDLPHRRPPRGRPGHRHLPDAGGGRRLGEARPGRDVPPEAPRGVPAPRACRS